MFETWHLQRSLYEGGKRGVLGCRERRLVRNEDVPGYKIVKCQCRMSMGVENTYFSQFSLVLEVVIPILD